MRAVTGLRVGFDTAKPLVAAGDNPETDPHRSRLGSSPWGSPDTGQLGEDHPASVEPRREPPS